MDEKTPHIHATVVPIVSGERRKAKDTDPAKKKYKTKKNRNRLCADDVVARDKLVNYQDSYAARMRKYGLERGISGSEARHISTPQFYRELYAQNEELEEDIQYLLEQKQDVYDSVRDLYDMKDEAREKYLNMDKYVKDKEKDISNIESRIQRLKQDYEPYKAQEELNFIHKLFPLMKEQLRIAVLCEKIGLAANSIIKLLEGKTLTSNSFKFYSPEHNHHFEAKEVRLKIEKEIDNPEILRLNLNGKNIMDWFKDKFKELHQRARINIQPKGKGRGL